jgi:predicted metal-dependent hydrolase
MVHLVAPEHNERFREIMDRTIPGWPLRADELNRTRLPDEAWEE